MTTPAGRPGAVGAGIILIASALSAPEARGDGGALRAWKRQGDVEIAVFTDPTPLVAGPVDVSVLLLDAGTGGPIPGARVTVGVAPEGRPGPATDHPATAGAATNKLLYAALFELRDPGRYRAEVTVDGPGRRARLRFDLDVAGRSAAPPGLLAWILWPVPVVVLYAVHRRLAGRKGRPGPPVALPSTTL